jgi:internalin A
MKTDLDIIKHLEKELDITFEEKFAANYHLDRSKTYAQYALNESEQVIKLRLRKLDLTEVPTSILQLANLQELDLMNNQLTIWPVEMAQLANLQRLSLMNNQLTTWPVEMAQLKIDPKKGIYLNNNPLETPPIEVIERGNKAIIAYYQSLQGKRQQLNEVKVLLVGDGGAGKTSLVKQLFDKSFDPNESQTHGIQINCWEIKRGDDTIKVHLWDFGGQEIMHATHQFFLSKRSLYILVLDGRKEEKTEYWLKHIESFGGTSPILVVLNKIDENPGFDVNRKFLKEKYQGIQNFYRLSCKTKQGFKEFSQALQDSLTQVEIHQTTWGQEWFNVKNQLEEMSEPFINYERYQEICAQQNILETEAQTTLVNFLHDLGVVLHFEEFTLEDTHVLEPKWATQAVYKIINSPQVADNKGILYFNQLPTILEPTDPDDYQYAHEKHRFIIELMKKFELCYDLLNQQVLIPDLLEVSEPTFDFNTSDALKFRLDYDFLPKSVIPRFIVRRHRDIKDNLRWRTGVVLSDKAYQATAVVKSDDEARKIYIEVNGSQRRDYFAIIRKTFTDINDSFEKLDIDERVCLPDETSVSVSLASLQGLEKFGKRTFIPEELSKMDIYKEYNVQELLGTVILEEDREKEILDYVKKTHDNVQEIQTKNKATTFQKTTGTFLLQPNLFGIGFNLNKVIDWVLRRTKKE